jgi:hypothetical protein
VKEDEEEWRVNWIEYHLKMKAQKRESEAEFVQAGRARTLPVMSTAERVLPPPTATAGVMQIRSLLPSSEMVKVSNSLFLRL